MTRRAGLLALFCAVAVPAGADDGPDTAKLDDAVEAFLGALPPGTLRNEAVCSANGFVVSSFDVGQLMPTVSGAEEGKPRLELRPTEARFQWLSVNVPGSFGVLVEKGRDISAGGGLVVTHARTREILLSVGDPNADGRLENLRYYKVDEAGKAILEVEDYDVDGQPDFRLNLVEHTMELWHADRWYRLERRDGRHGILVDNRFIEVRREQGRFFVP